MKKVKLIIIGIILALVIVFAFQNQDYFQLKHSLGLNLIVAGPYKTPEISNAVICIVAFLLGMIVFSLLTLSGRIKQRKSIKALNNSLNNQQIEITSLKSELDASRASTSGQVLPDSVSTPTSQGGEEKAAATL
jgi:type II secretory pathway pseudopilin PulG